MNNKYEPVIGLEVHAQMKTNTKAFCKCSTDFHSSPNSNICPICLGHPGTLPVLNKNLVHFILKMGLATNCEINEKSFFARKNYFYPDLPKGYQISQFETPICYNGFIELDSTKEGKRIGITRIHMEEDAGKSIHDFSDKETLIDLNRCGVPLIEIVSEPHINSSEEAYQYLNKIKQILIYLDINDGNMEEGSLRCDANVSIRPKGTKEFGTRTEIKNLNSFRNVVDAIDTEIARQIKLVESGEKVYYHTMTYNAKDKTTTTTRTKEEAHDYRYFPEPDLVEVFVSKELKDEITKDLPEFPDVRKKRFTEEYKIPKYDAEVLTQDKNIADYFENVVNYLDQKNQKTFKSVSNWVMIEIMRVLNNEKIAITDIKISEKKLAKLINLVNTETITNTIAKEVFEDMLQNEQDPEIIIKNKNLVQVTNASEIEVIIKSILKNNPSEVTRYKAGEKKLAGFFVGQIMRESKGKANPKIVNELLTKLLETN